MIFAVLGYFCTASREVTVPLHPDGCTVTEGEGEEERFDPGKAGEFW